MGPGKATQDGQGMRQPNPEESARVLLFAVLLVIVLVASLIIGILFSLVGAGLAVAGLFAEPWAIP